MILFAKFGRSDVYYCVIFFRREKTAYVRIVNGARIDPETARVFFGVYYDACVAFLPYSQTGKAFEITR